MLIWLFLLLIKVFESFCSHKSQFFHISIFDADRCSPVLHQAIASTMIDFVSFTLIRFVLFYSNKTFQSQGLKGYFLALLKHKGREGLTFLNKEPATQGLSRNK